MEDEGFSDELASRGDFSRMAEDFAWKNGCAGCPHKNLYGAHGLCLEAYGELLQNSVWENPAACAARFGRAETARGGKETVS